MATLNARLMVPGRGFRESVSIDDTEDPFFYKFSPSGVEINVQTATLRSSILNITQQPGGGAEFSLKRNSILDLKSQDIERDAKTMDGFQDHLIPVVNFASNVSTSIKLPCVYINFLSSHLQQMFQALL
jgi:hypothetical protein